MDSSTDKQQTIVHALFGDEKISAETFNADDWNQVVSFLKDVFSGSLTYYKDFEPFSVWLTNDTGLKTIIPPSLFGSETEKIMRTKCLLIHELPDTIRVWDSDVGEVSKGSVRTSEHSHLFVTEDWKWWSVQHRMEVSTDKDSYKLGKERPRYVLSVTINALEEAELAALLAGPAYTNNQPPRMGQRVLYSFNQLSIRGVEWRKKTLEEFVKRDRKLADVLRRLKNFPALDKTRY